MIHPSVLAAFEEIDAAIFNGDTFEDPETKAVLAEYVHRWMRWIGEHSESEPTCPDHGRHYEYEFCSVCDRRR